MELAQKLLSNLFPSYCLLCRKTLTGQAAGRCTEICQDCMSSLPYNRCCCVLCALPLPEHIGAEVLCGRCIKKTPAFDYAYSLFRYEGDIKRLVHQLKFGEKITYARSLGELLYELLVAKLLAEDDKPDCLLPVPLHKSRLRQRGFNQSIEIARVLSRKLQLPIEYDAVMRQRSTSAQTGLNAKQRQKNIKGAFTVKKDVEGKHVLIIDDVMTTGSTVNELAIVLKKNQAARVGVLSIARAPIKN